jgi:polysaccharide export outer membrane protein
MSLILKVFIFMRNAHRAFMAALLLLASGVGCATVPQKADLPPIEGGPGEMLERLTTLMQSPSEPRQVAVPATEIAAPPSIVDGGPAEYYKYLLTLMETPAVKHQAVPSTALAPPPSTPSATAMASLPPPAILPPPGKEETWTRELPPPPASRIETASINPGEQTPPSPDFPQSKEDQLSAKKLYRIGTEDVIRVAVWENPELTMDVTVRPDGKISLPLINEIHATDLTPIELSDVITENLKKYMKDPQVTVIVTQTNSQKIYLVGNVLRPGAYPLRHDMTVLQALSLAGGFTTFASPREMKIISGIGGKENIRKINYYKMIEDIELDNYMLMPGDTIVIP